jgi:hypothetical protein
MYRLLFVIDFRHALGSRSYVSGLFVDTRVVALLGVRTRRDLISCKVNYDHLGRQTPPLGHVNMPCWSVGRVIFPFHALLSFANSFGLLRVYQTPMAISSLGAPNAVLCRYMLHAIRANLFANAIASLLRCMRV